ncbi:MAG: hypothetical protein V7459_05570 [Oceanicoccus sp.]
MENKLSAVKFIVATALISLALVSRAETILLPIASQGDYLGDMAKPAKGQKQQQISSQFGEPMDISGPSGEPPITRWDYRDFSVYFEGDVVIHSVLKHRRLDSQINNGAAASTP